jgi:hypothetical protein
MRGQLSLITALPSSIEPKPEQKGQRNVHLDRRDDALAIRFYFYYQLEFFITPNVIIQRLNQRTDFMKELSGKNPKLADLKKMLPFYSWN